MTNSRPGFSLIEIMVVILIVGVLMGGTFTLITTVRRRAAFSATDQALRTTKMAIDSYRQDVGQLPNSLNDLLRRPSAPELASKWRGPYLEDAPEDGFGDHNELVYKRSPKGTRPPYKLFSWGKGGEGSPDEEHIMAK